MINTLFLIKGEEEYKIANAIVKTRQLKDFVILSLDENTPYLINKYSYLRNVSKWQDLGTQDLNLNRYSTNEFKRIENIVRSIIEKNYDDETVRNAYFIFEVVLYMGDAYYKYVDVLNKFFIRYSPKTVIFAIKRDFISTLLISLAGLYKANVSNFKGQA